jgi:hypothetical protein
MVRLLIFCVLLLGSQTLYSQFVPPRQGSIANSRGEQCEFITNVTTQSYFTETPQRIFIHTFQNYHYMLNREHSKSIIAATIVPWFNRSTGGEKELKFRTQFQHWIAHDEYEKNLKRGYAIPAENGEQFLFIDFEYSENQQYILRFMYTISEGVTY